MVLPFFPAQNLSPLTAQHAMVVSDHRLASEAGRDVMKRGGNAIDGAVATAFALAVVDPDAGNLGGGGFMMIRLASGEALAIDYREVAPAAATRDMYLAKASDSTVGYRAVAVPGTPAGLWEAHQRYGKLPWKAVIEPARRLASEGYVLSRERAISFRDTAWLFKKFPASYATFNRNGKFYTGGELFKQPELAATLGRLQQNARDIYEGTSAQLIANTMAKNNGLITLDDLRRYRPKVRVPLKGTFAGYDVLTMPPPSSGGIALLQLLGTVEGRLEGYGSVPTLHVELDAMKRAFADRAEFLGDPDYVKVPVSELLSPARIKAFREATKDTATPSDQIQPKRAALPEGNHTTHFTVVDDAGNAVSCTTTLNTGYGSGVTVPGAGFLLNNEMDDFASAPGRPNVFGLIQGEANAIAPGKRPLSSMTPTFVLKDGKLFAALGSPGGPTIINTVFQTILNLTVHKMDVQRAVSAPRIHHQWKPDSVAYEPFALTPETLKALEAKGYQFDRTPRTMGSCHAVVILGDGWRAAGCDPRLSDASAAGF